MVEEFIVENTEVRVSKVVADHDSLLKICINEEIQRQYFFDKNYFWASVVGAVKVYYFDFPGELDVRLVACNF